VVSSNFPSSPFFHLFFLSLFLLPFSGSPFETCGGIEKKKHNILPHFSSIIHWELGLGPFYPPPHIRLVLFMELCWAAVWVEEAKKTTKKSAKWAKTHLNQSIPIAHGIFHVPKGEGRKRGQRGKVKPQKPSHPQSPEQLSFPFILNDWALNFPPLFATVVSFGHHLPELDAHGICPHASKHFSLANPWTFGMNFNSIDNSAPLLTFSPPNCRPFIPSFWIIPSNLFHLQFTSHSDYPLINLGQFGIMSYALVRTTSALALSSPRPTVLLSRTYSVPDLSM
jgi:hypothetical protein